MKAKRIICMQPSHYISDMMTAHLATDADAGGLATATTPASVQVELSILIST